MTKIKICGLVRPEDAAAANRAMPDWVGLVFDKGRHFVTDRRAENIRSILDPAIPAVGVFVKEDPDRIISLVRRGIIQYVQLHGGESEEYLLHLKNKLCCPFIRAVSVKETADILQWKNSAADFLLLDHGKGGTGKSFNWSKIPPLEKPWFMAGGIGVCNLETALSYHPYGVDISSGAETNGIKDAEKMERLVKMVRMYRNTV